MVNAKFEGDDMQKIEDILRDVKTTTIVIDDKAEKKVVMHLLDVYAHTLETADNIISSDRDPVQKAYAQGRADALRSIIDDITEMVFDGEEDSPCQTTDSIN